MSRPLVKEYQWMEKLLRIDIVCRRIFTNLTRILAQGKPGDQMTKGG